MRKNLHLKTIRVLLLNVTAAIALISEGGVVPTQAGDDPGDLLNYSFAVWVGSGVYKVKSADKRFAVLRVPFAYTLRPDHYDKESDLIWDFPFNNEKIRQDIIRNQG